MDPRQLTAFHSLLYSQLRFLVIALRDIEDAHKSGRDVTTVFYGVQNALVASANISKILWGSKGRLADQRKALRDSIGVADNSPFRDVDMRNHFEHMDERIDLWWQNDGRGFVDLNIGPDGIISGLEKRDIFRWFNPATGEVVFWGERFDLKAIASEADSLLQELKKIF